MNKIWLIVNQTDGNKMDRFLSEKKLNQISLEKQLLNKEKLRKLKPISQMLMIRKIMNKFNLIKSIKFIRNLKASILFKIS